MTPDPVRVRAAGWGWAAFLTALVLAPVLVQRGFSLRGDMVFVPRQPWKDAWLGLDGSVPRAVPGDALVSLATHVLPGDLLQKVVLVAILLGAGHGMFRLTAGNHLLARLAAMSIFVWNPYVYERLAIGHWALLCGYAALPYVVVAARRVRDDAPGGVARLVPPVAVAAWTSPTGGVLAGLAAVAVLAFGRRHWATGGAVVIGLNLPWLLPGLVNASDQRPADVSGVAAFAARADTPWGALGSLLSFGGSWKESVDPAGRDSVLLSGLALALACAGLGGLALARRRDAAAAHALMGLGAVGLLLAWVPTVAPGAALVEGLVGAVPGAGILRDSQKWVALLALAAAAGLAALLDAAVRSRSGHGVFWAGCAAVTPLALLPALAWGQLGGLGSVSYPAEWTEVRSTMTAAAEGRTVVLPFDTYRRFGWNDERAVLDPAPRYLPGPVITDDELEVAGGTVAGESATAARISEAATDADLLETVLDDEGVRYVLVEKDTPGADAVPALAGTVLHDGDQLLLVDRGAQDPPESRGRPVLVLAVDVLVLLGALVAAIHLLHTSRGVYTRRR